MDGAAPVAEAVSILDVAQFDEDDLKHFLRTLREEARRSLLVSSVNNPEHRVRLLVAGFGDAVGDRISLVELAARAKRIADLGRWIPRSRAIATLELDLLAREAIFEGRPVGLYPREFGMLWRLADTPEEIVSKQTLLNDVWRLGFSPESNSIAVQISRMRSKLAAAGLDGLVETVSGGYRMSLSSLHPRDPIFRRASDVPDPRGA